MRFFRPTLYCILCKSAVATDNTFISDSKLCICSDCERRIEKYTQAPVFEGRYSVGSVIAAYPYQDPMKEAFAEYKFRGQMRFYTIFGELLYNALSEYVKPNDFDAVVPVPMSEIRLSERGFNQAELLSRVVSDNLGTELFPNALYKTRNTLRQSELSGFLERDRNVKGAYLADDRFVRNKKILLIDDIYTRGSTTGECAKELLKKGAKKVVTAVLFKSHIHDTEKIEYEFKPVKD